MFAALAFGNGQQQQQNRKTRVIAGRFGPLKVVSAAERGGGPVT
jgi:hypothetical protein